MASTRFHCPSLRERRCAHPCLPLSLLFAALLLVAPSHVHAEEEHGAQGHDAAGALPVFDASRRHHLSLLAGVTAVDEGTRGFTVGLDYEYRVNRRIGVGAVVGEYAFGSVEAATLLLLTDIHLWRGLALQTGPGVEILDLEREEMPRAEEHEEDQVFRGNGGPDGQFVYRVGLLYEVELPHGFTLSPQLHLDLVPPRDGDSIVFALAFGRAF